MCLRENLDRKRKRICLEKCSKLPNPFLFVCLFVCFYFVLFVCFFVLFCFVLFFFCFLFFVFLILLGYGDIYIER